ncbi:MAG: c(7)-type cytochrome triheme domain-containing protein [Nitrospinota bacterium]
MLPVALGPVIASGGPTESLAKQTILFDRFEESRKEAGEITPVLFSHILHEKALKCPDCHPDVFKAKLGENRITEQNNMDGEFCGFCHGEQLWECDFCHK